MKTKNDRPVKREIRRFGPLETPYRRDGYTLRWEYSDGTEFDVSHSLGFRIVKSVEHGGANHSPFAASFGSDVIVKPAGRSSNARKLILMEIPNELFEEIEDEHNERVALEKAGVASEINKEYGSLDIKHIK